MVMRTNPGFPLNFRFDLEEEKLIEFTQLAIAKAEGSDEMLNRVMTRDNIALAAVLKIKDSVYGGSELILVSSAHFITRALSQKVH